MALAKKSARSKHRATQRTEAKQSVPAKRTARPGIISVSTKRKVNTAKSSNAVKPATPAALDAARAQRAFEKLEPEYRALKASELLRVNADVATSAATALRAADRVESMADSFAKELIHFAPADLEGLRTLAFGAWYAALQARPNELEAAEFEKLVNEGIALREQFVVASEALAARKLFDAKTLKDIDRGVGHRDLAGDLTTFASIYTKNRARYAGKTAIEPSEVKRAAEIGSAIFEIVAKRDRAAKGPKTAAETKARAWTLFARAYDELRRAVTYVRWDEGDANAIAPSLFAAPHVGHPRVRAAGSETTPPAQTSTEAPSVVASEVERDAPVPEPDEAAIAMKRALSARRGGDPFGRRDGEK
jgi:hypothetical protein